MASRVIHVTPEVKRFSPFIHPDSKNNLLIVVRRNLIRIQSQWSAPKVCNVNINNFKPSF